MQLAMQALPEEKQGHALQVEIVATTWAPGNGGIKSYGKHDDEPADKHGGQVTIEHLHGEHHKRHIGQNYCPETPTTPSDCLQPSSKSGIVNNQAFANR